MAVKDNRPDDVDEPNIKKIKKQAMVAGVDFADEADTSLANVSFYPIEPCEEDDADAMIDDFDVIEEMTEDEFRDFAEGLATSEVFWRSRVAGTPAFVYINDEATDAAVFAGGAYEKFY